MPTSSVASYIPSPDSGGWISISRSTPGMDAITSPTSLNCASVRDLLDLIAPGEASQTEPVHDGLRLLVRCGVREGTNQHAKRLVTRSRRDERIQGVFTQPLGKDRR